MLNTDLIELFRERVTNINRGLEVAFGVKINMYLIHSTHQ